MKLKSAAYCAGMFALATLGAQPIHATQIVASQNGSASANATYGQTYSSGTGYTSSGTGSTTTTGTAPGLFQIFLTGSVSDPFGNFARPSFANSSVGVDLYSGDIKIQGAGGPCYDTGVPVCGGGYTSTGNISEGVTFDNTTGTTVTVGFGWHVNINATGDATRSQLGGSTTFAALGGEITYDFSNCVNSFTNCSGLDGSRTGGWSSLSMSPDGNFGEDFEATIGLNPGIVYTTFFENFNLICGLGASCDGSHTASLRVDLPAGVTFTSDSGVYLTEAGDASVPEPGSAGLLAAGALAAGLLRRRYRTGER